MRVFNQLIVIVIFAFIFSSCAKVYYSTDAYDLAKNHRTIAIIQPSVTIALNRNIDSEQLKEKQNSESANIQRSMYAWILDRKMQKKLTLEVQDIETTNALLRKALYPENPLTSAELCEVLGVDAVMTSHYNLSKPMGEIAAIATDAAYGVKSTTNEVSATLSINDCSQKKLIWNYKNENSGGIGVSLEVLVDGLISNASKNLPYSK